MINFKANLIHNTTIQKRGLNNRYDNYSVSFVELNPNNFQDVVCINKANATWKDSDTYADDIAYKLNSLFQGSKNEDSTRFFAIAKQNARFHELDYSDVLGLAEIAKERDGAGIIRLFQVRPDTMRGVENREYKKVGLTLLDNLLKVMKEKTIYVDATDAGASLYAKKGFKIHDSFGRMILKR